MTGRVIAEERERVGSQVADFTLTLRDFAASSSTEPHRHQGFAVGVVLTGQLMHRTRRAAYECPPLSVVAKLPGSLHGSDTGEARCQGLLVEFAPSVMARLPPKTRDRLYHREVVVGRAVAPIAWRLRREVWYSDDLSSLAIEGLLLSLLASLSRDSGAQGDWPRWLGRVMERLRALEEGKPSLADLAAMAGVSRRHLARVFREHHGQSVGEWLRAHRIERALSLIAESERPFAEVALLAGFSDQSHLGRTIKRETGATPRQLRTSSTRGRSETVAIGTAEDAAGRFRASRRIRRHSSPSPRL